MSVVNTSYTLTHSDMCITLSRQIEFNINNCAQFSFSSDRINTRDTVM